MCVKSSKQKSSSIGSDRACAARQRPAYQPIWRACVHNRICKHTDVHRKHEVLFQRVLSWLEQEAGKTRCAALLPKTSLLFPLEPFPRSAERWVAVLFILDRNVLNIEGFQVQIRQRWCEPSNGRNFLPLLMKGRILATCVGVEFKTNHSPLLVLITWLKGLNKLNVVMTVTSKMQFQVKAAGAGNAKLFKNANIFLYSSDLKDVNSNAHNFISLISCLSIFIEV